MTTRLLFWLCLAGLGVGGGVWLAESPGTADLAWLLTHGAGERSSAVVGGLRAASTAAGDRRHLKLMDMVVTWVSDP